MDNITWYLSHLLFLPYVVCALYANINLAVANEQWTRERCERFCGIEEREKGPTRIDGCEHRTANPNRAVSQKPIPLHISRSPN